MFKFGKRNVTKQGGSFMIALPMQWMKSVNPKMKTVVIEMDSGNNLIIVAGDTLQDAPSFKDIQG